MFPILAFMAFSFAAGATVSQTVPEVNKAVDKYIVQADHNEDEKNSSNVNPK